MTTHEVCERVDIALLCREDEVVVGSDAGVVHGLRSGWSEHRDVGQSSPTFDDG